MGGFRSFADTRSGDKVAPIPTFPIATVEKFTKVDSIFAGNANFT
jgi:hypothetical protein